MHLELLLASGHLATAPAAHEVVNLALADLELLSDLRIGQTFGPQLDDQVDIGVSQPGPVVVPADNPRFLSCPRGKCRKPRLDAGLARDRRGTKWVSRTLP